ncbi:MAG: integrase core domain-containing protein [Dehalococcoidales bacterium]|nr:integrase core domain-containing protein [Dehalococcoidales bacterium]
MSQYSTISPAEPAMRVVSTTNAGLRQLSRQRLPDLSSQAKKRLKWVEYYQACGRNASLTCRHFDISRPTLYRWLHRYQPRNLRSLEDRGCVPKHRRTPAWTLAQMAAVRRLREQYPRWGKDKLVVLLRHEGLELSTSMVGRILRRLRVTGQLVEPKRGRVQARPRRRARPYAVRKPKGYRVEEPGDLVQVDTLDVRLCAGCEYKQFTARDMVSRWDVVAVGRSATARGAAKFLEQMLVRMPFRVKGVQIDGGSEFMGEFEAACQAKGLKLIVLPPRSPKLNGSVERAQRTHTEEFWQVTEAEPELAAVRTALAAWESVYNTVRPHQALGYLTPAEYLKQWQSKQAREEAL